MMHRYHYYVAQQFANTIANELPKFRFKNKKLEKQWEIISNENNLLKINYELVRNCSLHGKMFLGLNKFKNKEQDSWVLTLGKVLNEKQVGLKTTILSLIIDSVKMNGSKYMITENWNLESEDDKYICYRYGIFDDKSKHISIKDLNWNLLKNKNISHLKDKIPYTKFIANAFEMPDLYNVPENWFKQIDDNMALLQKDSITSRGMIGMNTPFINNKNNLNALENDLEDITKILIKNDNYAALMSGEILSFMQGHSQADALIKKLDFLDTKIKNFGFVKTNSGSLGVKNTNNSEIETLNADADDYLENKANLLEICWKKFIDEIVAPTFGIKEDVEVECSGSTKYLKNKANIYVQNQNGILTNPNDLVAEKNKSLNNNDENTKQ